jgi:uncharacterized protein (TIGR03437 family)
VWVVLLLWISISGVAAGSPVLNGVVNAASYRIAAVAPGEMVTLFGSGMGPASLAGLSLDPSGKVSSAVAGTRVLFDGTPSPILYTSNSQVSVVVPYAVANRGATQVQVVQGYAAGTVVGALPYQLANATVSFGKIAAPILNVANTGGVQSMVVQVPCEVSPGTVPVTVQVGGGVSSTTTNVLPASPGIFGSAMADGVTRAVLVRPDGSFVSLQNPARRGETIRLYVTGLGPLLPAMASNSVPPPGTDSLAVGQVIVGINNSGALVLAARAAPDRIGVYEIAFQVPSDAPTGNDIVLNVAVNAPGVSSTAFSGGSKIPIQ